MPVVPAEVKELSWRALLGLLEQLGLLESLPGRLCRAHQGGQVGEADLTPEEGLQAGLHLPHPPAHRHPVRDRTLVHVAVVADPVDRGDRASLLPVVGLGKASRQPGEEQLLLVDLVPEEHQVLGQLGPRSLALNDEKTLLSHAHMIRTKVPIVNSINSNTTTPGARLTPRRAVTPSSQSVLTCHLLQACLLGPKAMAT